MTLRARRLLDAGADHIMIESEGLTENVAGGRAACRTDVPARAAESLRFDRVMFEAADPAVFSGYVQTFGPEPLRRPQPDRPARMPALGDMGDERAVGEGAGA